MPDAETANAAVLARCLSEMLLRRFRARIYARIETGVDAEVRDGTFPVLNALHSGPCRMTELADRAGVDRTTASRQVAGLSEAGLVQTDTGGDDRRNTVVSLTAAGEAAAERLADNTDRMLREATADWHADDRDALARLLPRLIDELRG